MIDDETLRAAVKAHTAGVGKFTRRMAITIADLAGMRPMALVKHLEERGLLRPGAWAWFKRNGGITAEHCKEVRRK